MKMTRLMLLGVAMVAPLSGCQTLSAPAAPTLAPDFGNAVKANAAVQVVNPEAGKDERAAPPMDGQKAEQVMKGYRTDKGKAPTERLLIDIGTSN